MRKKTIVKKLDQLQKDFTQFKREIACERARTKHNYEYCGTEICCDDIFAVFLGKKAYLFKCKHCGKVERLRRAELSKTQRDALIKLNILSKPEKKATKKKKAKKSNKKEVV